MFFRRSKNWFYFVPFVFVIDSYAGNDNAVSVGASTEWTDNVRKSSGKKQDDIITNLILGVSLDGDDSFYQYGMDYTLSHENYMDDSFEDSNYWSGQAYFNLLALNDRLKWSNRLGSSVTERNSTLSNTPDNRDQRTNLSTGLDFYLMNTIRDRVYASLLASRILYREATQNDSDRYQTSMSWDHSFNSLTSGGVSCSAEVAEFPEQPSYDAYSCGLSASRRINHGNVIGQIGGKTIEGEDDKTFDGVEYYFRAGWSPGSHRLHILTKRDVTDTTVGFTQSVFSDTTVDNAEVLEDPVNATLDVNTDAATLTQRTRTEVGYGLKFSPTFMVNTRIFRDNDDRFESDDDVLREGVGFNINKNLARHSKIAFNYRYERRQSNVKNTDENKVEPYTLVVDYYNAYTVRYTKLFSERFQMEAWFSGDEKRNRSPDKEYDAYSIAASAQYTF